METLKLLTIIKFVDPELERLLTSNELEIPIVLKDGIESVSSDDVLEIIQASIYQKKNGTLMLQ